MTYKAILPNLFTPFEVNRADLPKIVGELCKPHGYDENNFTPNGSSFAVTSDADQGKANLWLSSASISRLAKAGLTHLLRKAGAWE